MKDEQAIREFMLISEAFGRPDAVTALKWVLGEWPTPEPEPCAECNAHLIEIAELRQRACGVEEANRILTDSNRNRQRIIEELQIKLMQEQGK